MSARRLWTLLAALGLAAVLLAAGCSGSGKSSPSAGGGRTSQGAASKGQTQGTTIGKGRPVARLGHPVLGKRSAPVTMIEYGDYQ